MGKIKPLVLCLCFVLLFSAFSFGVFAENEGDSPLTESVAEAESESVTGDESEADFVSEDNENEDLSSTSSEGAPITYTVSYGYKKVQASTGETPQNYVQGTAPESQIVLAGGSHTVEANTFKFRDYIFNGWSCTYTNENGESVTKYYSPGEVIYNIQSDMHLCATWRREELDFEIYGVVSFDGASEAGRNVCIGDVFKIPAPAAGADAWVSEGRIFFEGDRFYVSSLITEFEPYYPDDNYLAGNVVSVSYDLNGGSGNAQSSFTATPGKGFKVDGCNAEKKGCTFVGWAIDGGSNLYREGDTCLASENVNFVAVWNEVSKPADKYYTVKLSAGEGGSVSPYGQISVKKGEACEFTVTADKYFKISSVTYNGEELGVGGSYKMTVNGDSTVKAVFESDGTYPSEDEVSEESYESVSSEELSEQTVSKEDSATHVINDQTVEESDEDGNAGAGFLALVILGVVLVIGALIVFIVRALKKQK